MKLEEVQKENESLKIVTDSKKIAEIEKIIEERDKYKDQCKQMEKFLADYGFTWIGNESGDQKS